MRFQRWLLINYTLCGAWYKALWNGCCSFKIHGESYMYFLTTEHYIDEAKNSFNYSGDSLAHCHCMPRRLTRIIDYILTVFLNHPLLSVFYCCCFSVWKIIKWPTAISPILKAVVDFAGSHLGVTNILIQCTVNYHLPSFTNLYIWTFCCANNRKVWGIFLYQIFDPTLSIGFEKIMSFTYY